MTVQDLTLIGLFLSLIAYVMTLYHLAHGNERKAVELGARIVIDAMVKDGRLMPDPRADEKGEAINIGEDDYEPVESGLPDIIVARNQRAAEQMGERINNDLMRAMDEKI